MPTRTRRRRSPSSRAGEYVREEIHHIREGKHGARSAKQAIAIGLSKARRAGVKLPPPKPGMASARTRRQAMRESSRAERHEPVSPRRSAAMHRRLEREGRAAGSHRALSAQAREAARRRGPAARSRSAQKAARTRARRRAQRGRRS
ncbi:MAG TPA: DUF6496 domain-containing protein [Myxococcota bacterium]|nr:DUF6496 domain-containing protein [Myxococcota bacterium]